MVEQRATQPRERPLARAGVGPRAGTTAGPARYLLNACKGGCEYSLADFFPLYWRTRIGRRSYRRRSSSNPAAPGEGGWTGCGNNQRRRVDGVEVDATRTIHRLPEEAWPPDAKVLRAARRCVPMHVAKASCYASRLARPPLPQGDAPDGDDGGALRRVSAQDAGRGDGRRARREGAPRPAGMECWKA